MQAPAAAAAWHLSRLMGKSDRKIGLGARRDRSAVALSHGVRPSVCLSVAPGTASIQSSVSPAKCLLISLYRYTTGAARRPVTIPEDVPDGP